MEGVPLIPVVVTGSLSNPARVSLKAVWECDVGGVCLLTKEKDARRGHR